MAQYLHCSLVDCSGTFFVKTFKALFQGVNLGNKCSIKLTWARRKLILKRMSWDVGKLRCMIFCMTCFVYVCDLP